MQTFKKTLLATSVVAASTAMASQSLLADAFTEALTGGKASGSFNLRYEGVEDDFKTKDDAKALTLRSSLAYTTGKIGGFDAKLEFEDVRVVGGVDEYNDKTGNGADYSVIADPEVTEVNQAFIQYNSDLFGAKYGRQELVLDNARFVGNVGWRQDHQSFDAFSTTVTPLDKLKITYAYLFKRNRIFGEEADIDSKDHILNASFDTGVGKLTGYSYLLEQDDDSELAFDTYGARFSGGLPLGDDLKLLYTAEYATQEKSGKALTEDFDTDYTHLEAGVGFSGFTVKLGAEVLGSDDGKAGFSTPLATGHAFNGWSDQFLGTPDEGLVDMYASVSAGLLGGKFSLIYHDYSADEDTDLVDDLGDEINAVYAYKFGKHYNVGIKYAAYSAGDDTAGKVDTDKLWVWAGAKF